MCVINFSKNDSDVMPTQFANTCTDSHLLV